MLSNCIHIPRLDVGVHTVNIVKNIAQGSESTEGVETRSGGISSIVLVQKTKNFS